MVKGRSQQLIAIGAKVIWVAHQMLNRLLIYL
jgi:hypothetical protein